MQHEEPSRNKSKELPNKPNDSIPNPDSPQTTLSPSSPYSTDENNAIDPFKLNIVSRLGANWYGKTNKDSLYEIAKPISRMGMGIDKLPEEIRNSVILTGNELAILASAENIPAKKEFTLRDKKNTEEKHILAKELLSQGKTEVAWQILL